MKPTENKENCAMISNIQRSIDDSTKIPQAVMEEKFKETEKMAAMDWRAAESLNEKSDENQSNLETDMPEEMPLEVLLLEVCNRLLFF